MSRFFGHLSWSILGGVTGSLLMFATSILGGRILGPSDFGVVILVITIAQAVTVLAPLGIDLASSRALPRAPVQLRPAILSTAVTAVTAQAVLIAGVLVAASGVVADLIPVDSAVIAVGVLYGLILTLRTLMERQLSGLQMFRTQALVRPWEGMVAISALGAIYFTDRRMGWPGMVQALALGGMVVTAAYAHIVVRRMRRAAISFSTARELLSYGVIALVHAVTPVGFVYADKFLVHHWLGADQLGVYGAYYSTSFLVIAQLLAVISNVLFPTSAALADRRPTIDKLVRLRLVFTLPVAIGLTLLLRVVIELYGPGFQPSFVTSMAAGLWGSLVLFNGLLTVVAVTHSRRAYLYVALFQGVRSLVFIAALVMLQLADTLSVDTVFLCLIVVEMLDAANLATINRRVVLSSRVASEADRTTS